MSCNGRHEVGFAIPQRAGTPATESAWTVSSASTVVDMTMSCSAAALPNTFTGYSGTPGDLGLAVSDITITMKADGVHWQNAVPAAGVDYSAVLGAMPTGNGSLAGGTSSLVACTAVAGMCM